MADDYMYTQDGTVDIHNRPANRKKTGNWKACRSILGIFLYNIYIYITYDSNII